MKLFAITAQVVHATEDGWSTSVGVPSFLLSDRQVQTEAEAEAWARRIVDPLSQADEVHVCAVAL